MPFSMQRFSLYLLSFSSLLQVTAGTIHVLEVLDFIRDSDFESRLFSCKISSVQTCHEVVGDVASSECRKN